MDGLNVIDVFVAEDEMWSSIIRIHGFDMVIYVRRGVEGEAGVAGVGRSWTAVTTGAMGAVMGVAGVAVSALSLLVVFFLK